MWEELVEQRLSNRKRRIIPACAGRTLLELSSCLLSWDHPRVCGKNVHCNNTTISRLGSPPRVREELIDYYMCIITVRITPACAGRTTKEEILVMALQDHPRVCGKNVLR